MQFSADRQHAVRSIALFAKVMTMHQRENKAGG
jgi:hypothetical protein